MTPREPDRYEEKAREVTLACRHVGTAEVCNSCVAAALRAVKAETLERAAQVADESREDGRCIAFAIRAMKKPDATSAVRPRCNYMTPTGEQCLLPAVPHTHINDAEPAAAPAAEPSEPAAPAPDPCQRCSKLGGHPVDFRFDGILMGRWICPHCLDAQEKRIAELEAAIRWALGEEDEFATREPGEGAYWWRTELRRRAKLAVRAATSSTPGDGSAKK